MKVELRKLGKYATLYRDDRTGIAWVEDGASGNGYSAHANIDVTGSVAGMKQQGYWRKDARTVRSHGFIYNIDTLIVTHEYDRIAANACTCQACIERRKNKCDEWR